MSIISQWKLFLKIKSIFFFTTKDFRNKVGGKCLTERKKTSKTDSTKA